MIFLLYTVSVQSCTKKKKRDYNHLGFFFIVLVYFRLWSCNKQSWKRYCVYFNSNGFSYIHTQKRQKNTEILQGPIKSFKFSLHQNFWWKGMICILYTVIVQILLVPGIRNFPDCSMLAAQSKLVTVLTTYFCFPSAGALSCVMKPFQLSLLATGTTLLPLAAGTDVRSFPLACWLPVVSSEQ